MEALDREILRRGGLGADVLSALASLVALGHDPAVEIQAELGNLRDASRAAMRLAPLGWAPCGLLPVRDYVRAGHALDAHGAGAADEFLADAWEASWMLPGVLVRIRALGAGIDASIRAVSERRGGLVEVAWRCHETDTFDASIPIVLAQVEGICFDASGKAFFSRHPNRRADVTDEVTLAGLDTALGSTRDALSIDVRPSAATGLLARHGIAHGREVAYGTRVNSWKCWVLLLAIWEWANQRLRERDERRVEDAETRWAGSNETDEEGRRRDRRGFPEARLALRDLAISQMGFYRTFGRFASLPELDQHLPGMGDRSAVHLGRRPPIAGGRGADRPRDGCLPSASTPILASGVTGMGLTSLLLVRPARVGLTRSRRIGEVTSYPVSMKPCLGEMESAPLGSAPSAGRRPHWHRQNQPGR